MLMLLPLRRPYSPPPSPMVQLEVLARLAVQDLDFLRGTVLREVVRLLGSDRSLLEGKGSFIIRRLCLLLEPETVYVAVAAILADESNGDFSALLVELLHLVLLTALETQVPLGRRVDAPGA